MSICVHHNIDYYTANKDEIDLWALTYKNDHNFDFILVLKGRLMGIINEPQKIHATTWLGLTNITEKS